jgi:hypothetical protein
MVAGIGCRAGVSSEQVEAAIAGALAALQVAADEASGAPGRGAHDSAAASAGEPAATARDSARSALEAAARRDGLAAIVTPAAGPVLTAIATPAAKATEPGIQAAAAARGLPILAISQPDLEAANAATVTRSARSMAALNVHSVAEAAALAGAATLAKAMPPTIHAKTVPATASLAATQVSATAVPATASLAAAHVSAKATVQPPTNPIPRLLQPRVAVGPVTCALADTTSP